MMAAPRNRPKVNAWASRAAMSNANPSILIIFVGMSEGVGTEENLWWTKPFTQEHFANSRTALRSGTESPARSGGRACAIRQ